MTRGQGVERFYVHTVTVETFLGTNGYGADTYAPAVAVPCFLDGARKLVRGKSTEMFAGANGFGAQVVSESTLYTYPVNASLFVANSRVTTDDGVCFVIRTNSNTSGKLNLPDHIAVSLT